MAVVGVTGKLGQGMTLPVLPRKRRAESGAKRFARLLAEASDEQLGAMARSLLNRGDWLPERSTVEMVAAECRGRDVPCPAVGEVLTADVLRRSKKG